MKPHLLRVSIEPINGMYSWEGHTHCWCCWDDEIGETGYAWSAQGAYREWLAKLPWWRRALIRFRGF